MWKSVLKGAGLGFLFGILFIHTPPLPSDTPSEHILGNVIAYKTLFGILTGLLGGISVAIFKAFKRNK